MNYCDDRTNRRIEPSATLTRRSLSKGLAAVCVFAGLLPQSAAAQSYPTRSVRMVVAFAPGGITDIIARLMSESLTNSFGQSFFVDNKGGAAGAIGAKFVAGADADGYTLLATTTAVAINSAASSAEINPSTQLTPIAIIATAPTLLVVKAPNGAKNLSDFVQAHGKGELTFSSAGTGTTEHLTAAYVFKNIAGIEAVHIPYRSGGEAVNAALGGHVDIASVPTASALALIQEGKLVPLAVASHKRVAMLPDVPTLAEAGLMDVENASWIAIFGPANLPPLVAQTLSTRIDSALHESAFRNRIGELGFAVADISQPDLAHYMAQEVVKWREILKTTGVTLE
jgi:tripartite-type tricarboxylate transporter receptor subunit TctC